MDVGEAPFAEVRTDVGRLDRPLPEAVTLRTTAGHSCLALDPSPVAEALSVGESPVAEALSVGESPRSPKRSVGGWIEFYPKQ